MEPTAAPMRVLRVARRIRSSKMIMQTAIKPPAPAEIHGELATGFRMYPAEIRNAGINSRMRTTSACITKAYYHAAIASVTEIAS